jgi:ribosome-associated protein
MDFKIEGEWIELCSLLKVTGMAESGGEAKLFIADSRVKVNGIVETRKTCKIKPGSVVEFNGGKIVLQ